MVFGNITEVFLRAFINTYVGAVLFKYLNIGNCKSFPAKNFIGLNLQKFSPVNFPSINVHITTIWILVDVLIKGIIILKSSLQF